MPIVLNILNSGLGHLGWHYLEANFLIQTSTRDILWENASCPINAFQASIHLKRGCIFMHL